MIYDPEAAGALCSRCPLRGKKVVPPHGPLDPDIVVVGEGPGMQEERQQKPFVGPSGGLLNGILQQAGFERSRVWTTNALLCRADTPGVSGSRRYDLNTFMAYIRSENAKAKKSERVRAKMEKRKPNLAAVPQHSSPLECCAPRLWNELNYFEQVARMRGDLNGLVVVPVGNYAALAVTGKKGILKLRGSPMAPVSSVPQTQSKESAA